MGVEETLEAGTGKPRGPAAHLCEGSTHSSSPTLPSAAALCSLETGRHRPMVL